MIRVSWSSHFSIYLVCVTTHLKSYLSTHSFRDRFPLVLTASCAVTDFCRFEQLIALCSCSWNQLVPGLGLEGIEGTHSFPAKSATWLDVVDRVRFRVCLQVFRCLHKMAPEYLSTYCQPVSGISGRRHLVAIGWPWSSWFPTCETCFVRRTFICIRRPFELELSSCLP